MRVSVLEASEQNEASTACPSERRQATITDRDWRSPEHVDQSEDGVVVAA